MSTIKRPSSRQRRRRRLVAVQVAALAISTAGLGIGVGTADASTALLLGGKNKYKVLTEEQMSQAFGGYFQQYDKRVNIPFPGSNDLYMSTEVGTANLYNAVYDPAYAGQALTIGGVSEGAPSVLAVMRMLQADADNPNGDKVAPTHGQLNVTIYGTPSGRFLGTLNLPLPQTQYDLVVVTAQYDGAANFPDNAWNGLAVVNALLGGTQLHVKQSNFDIRNEDAYYHIDINKLGGKTTIVMIPTAVLPILAPMVALHFDPDFVAKVDAMLRPVIDSAYDSKPAGYWSYGIVPVTSLPGPPGPDTPAETTPTPVTTVNTVAANEVKQATVAALKDETAVSDDSVTDETTAPVTNDTTSDTTDTAPAPKQFRDGIKKAMTKFKADLKAHKEAKAAKAAKKKADSAGSGETSASRETSSAGASSGGDSSE